MNSKDGQELHRIDGEPLESEWNVFPGHSTSELLQEIQINLAKGGIKPENFRDRGHLHVDVQ